MRPPLWRILFVTFYAIAVLNSSTATIDVGSYFQGEQRDGRTTVDTKLGQVVGRILPGGVRAFLGIPYALPPVGNLRFEPPVPLESWGTGKLEALEFGAECMQITTNSPSPPPHISEDCLFVNVWTPPGARKSLRLPVMVWLYGGGFQQGASSHPEYDGARMAELGVIVVSVNYRVGALGWMVSVTDNLWGNYGLQDQRVGIEWVHKHVPAFGGDPGRVTLFGESAGAMSIGQHLFMDGAGVLFHQAIMQSNPMGYRFRSVTVANFLGEAMKRGLDCYDLDCLQGEPASEVLRVQESLMGVPRSVGDFFTWGPVITDKNYRRHVEKHQKTWNYNEDGFAGRKDDAVGESRGTGGGRSDEDATGKQAKTKHGLARRGPSGNYTAPFMNVVQPLEVLASEIAAGAAAATDRSARGRKREDTRERPPVPLILGVNADEGLMFVHGAFPVTMPKLVYYSFVTALFRTSVVGVLRAYGYLADQCEESGDYRRVMSQIMHDYLFRCPNLRAAQLLQERRGAKAPVYVYQFSHPTEVPGFPECSGNSCHTAELPYVFNNMDIVKETYSYHESSGSAATLAAAAAARAVPSAGHSDDAVGARGDGQGGNDTQQGFGAVEALSMVGNAVGGVAGGVAGGVVGVLRSGLGVGGRLFRRQAPAEEVADAIGAGGVGFAGNVVATAAATEASRDAMDSDDDDSSRAADQAAQRDSAVADGAAISGDGRPSAHANDPSLHGEGGLETTARGLEGSSCDTAAGTLFDEAEADGPAALPRPPSVREAAEADLRVGDAMVKYWTSFGKAGDPNSESTPVAWPGWEGRRMLDRGDSASAAAMAAMLSSGRGGVGKGSFTDVFSEAWSHAGEGAGGAGPGWEGGSFLLDIKAQPEVREAKRDCLCEFWDRLKYRH